MEQLSEEEHVVSTWADIACTSCEIDPALRTAHGELCTGRLQRVKDFVLDLQGRLEAKFLKK